MASELIVELQNIVAEHGDMPVLHEEDRGAFHVYSAKIKNGLSVSEWKAGLISTYEVNKRIRRAIVL